jgi:hypothetical protein
MGLVNDLKQVYLISMNSTNKKVPYLLRAHLNNRNKLYEWVKG